MILFSTSEILIGLCLLSGVISAIFMFLEDYQEERNTPFRKKVERYWKKIGLNDWLKLPEIGLELFVILKNRIDKLDKVLLDSRVFKNFGVLIFIFSLLQIIAFNIVYNEFNLELGLLEISGIILLSLLIYFISSSSNDEVKKTEPNYSSQKEAIKKEPKLIEKKISDKTGGKDAELKLALETVKVVLEGLGKIVLIFIVAFFVIIFLFSFFFFLLGIKWIPKIFSSTIHLLFYSEGIPLIPLIAVIFSFSIIIIFLSLGVRYFLKLFNSFFNSNRIIRNYSWGTFFIGYLITLFSFILGYITSKNDFSEPTIQILISNLIFDYLTIIVTFEIIKQILAIKRILNSIVLIFLDFVIAAILGQLSIYFGLFGTEFSISFFESFYLLVGDFENVRPLYHQYFYIIHTTFLPTIIYLGIIFILLMSKLILNFIKFIIIPNSTKRHYSLLRRLFIVVGALCGFLSFICKYI